MTYRPTRERRRSLSGTLALTARVTLSALAALSALPAPALAQSPGLDPDTVQVGRFDFGRMWTFEYPPVEYFTATYGFQADQAWFDRARTAALRIPGCSASFVSPNGLVVTNHHCARGAITRVSREGENLLDEGFYATSLDEERRIPDYWADQLVAAEDVSDEILAAVDAASPQGRQQARERAVAAVRERIQGQHAGGDPVRVDVVPLYHGGRYSAYVFRRFTDVRLVAAAELQLGFFGGDPDNFTYPRYALDFTFYRIYDDNGEPYRPTHHFTWGSGVAPGDAVFVIGNPGPTNRLLTVAQLEHQRDVFVPVRKHFFETRLKALRDAYAADPVTGERLGLRNTAFSLSNSLKAYTGRLAALRDPYIMARKAAAERALVDSMAADADVQLRYGDLIDRVGAVQAEKLELAGAEGAFFQILHPTYGSRTLRRALAARSLVAARQQGAPADTVAALRQALLEVDDHPGSLERDLLTLRLQDLERYLGADHPVVRAALGGAKPAAAADRILSSSVLADEARTRAAVEGSGVPAEDPGLRLMEAILPAAAAHAQAAQVLGRQEQELAADLGRARFEVYGTDVAPDATSSPRITDGVVRGYEYNGTLAPPYTTMFGLYDHFNSYGAASDWALPDRWLPVPAGLDLSTPLDFVSTADTYGGNSGSPAVTRDLAIVGLNFDRNIEGLSRDFIYLPDRGRNIMVDVRAIQESLDDVYDADRIVLELLTGRLARTEAEADAVRR